MGGKKPIGAMPSRGSMQRYGSSRGRAASNLPNTPHSAYLNPSIGDQETAPSQLYYSLFSGLNLAENGQPWIFKDEKEGENSEKTREKSEGESENDPKQRLFDIAETFVHTLYDAISTEMSVQPVEEGSAGTGAAQQSVVERLNGFALALDNLTNQVSRISQTLTILEKQIMTRTSAEDTQRLHERLSTLEGRQSAIQSKISQLDNIFGSSTGLWSRNVKKFQDFYERSTQSPGSCQASVLSSGQNSPRSQDSGSSLVQEDSTQEMQAGVKHLEQIWRAINDDREHYRNLEAKLLCLEKRLGHECRSGSDDELSLHEFPTTRRQAQKSLNGTDETSSASSQDAPRFDTPKKRSNKGASHRSHDRDTGRGNGGGGSGGSSGTYRHSPPPTRM